MHYEPHAFNARQIDVQLFLAVENNAIDQVVQLLQEGGDPHALVPVSLSQFRSAFRHSKLTHLTATFRALQLYRDDAILGRLMVGTAIFPRIPAAYAFASGAGEDIHGETVEVDGRLVVVTDLLVGMSTLELIAPANRMFTAEMISMRLATDGAASFCYAGDVACDHVARFLASGSERELEQALALFNTGARIRGDEAGWQALARMRGMARQHDKKNSIELSLPIVAMFITEHPHGDMGARLLDVLLKNRAIDPDFRERGLSLLHWAAFLDDATAIHHLLDHGADAHALSDPGSEFSREPATPDEIADMAGNQTSASVLRAFNARSRMQSVIDLVKQRMAEIPRKAPDFVAVPVS